MAATAILVLAPDSVQEMADLTVLAFDLADHYRNPVFVLADGFIGQMMEPLEFKMRAIVACGWSVKGNAETQKNLISSIVLEPDELERHVRKLEAKYQLAQELESRYESYLTEDAEILLVGFGIVSRVLRTAVDQLRAQAVVASFRPLSPSPSRELCQTARDVKQVLAVELSTGMMVEDVKLALNGTIPVEYYGRVGGNVPSAEEMGSKVFAHGSPRGPRSARRLWREAGTRRKLWKAIR